MDYAEKLFRTWVEKEGLHALYIINDWDDIGAPDRSWFFFNGLERISPREGLCDEEVVMFFSASHELTFTDRLLMDCQNQ